MSFSNQVKKEISLIKQKTKIESIIELSAILKTAGSISLRNALINISINTENEDVAKKIYTLIHDIYNYESVITLTYNNNIQKDGLYIIKIEDEDIAKKIMSDSLIDLYGNYIEEVSNILSRIQSSEKNQKAYIRGSFMGGGSVVDPSKNYHLEIVFSSKEDFQIFKKTLKELGIDILLNIRKEKYIAYIKNSSTISDFFGIIGATNSLLDMENILIEKELRNNINRQVNCDTANINKVIKTSQKHLEDIEYFEKNYLEPINEKIIEVIEIRKKYPYLSLKELSNKTNGKISKSNIAHKLKKISDIVKEIKKSKK